MGQEWSWPCATRKEENTLKKNRYVEEDVYDDNVERYTVDPELKRQNMQKIEKLVMKKDYLRSNQIGNSPPDTSKSPFDFTDDSFFSTMEPGKLLVVCQKISNFPQFAEKQTEYYNYVILSSNYCKFQLYSIEIDTKLYNTTY